MARFTENGLLYAALLATIAGASACSSGGPRRADGRGEADAAATLAASAAEDPVEIARSIASRHERVAAALERGAQVRLRPLGASLVPAPELTGRPLHIDVDVPLQASGTLRVEPLGDHASALSLTPHLASNVQGELGADGRIVYRGAFGSTDLVTSITARSLHQTLVLRNDRAPAAFVWDTSLGKGTSLHLVEGDDGESVLADGENHVRLSIHGSTVADASGRESPIGIAVDA